MTRPITLRFPGRPPTLNGERAGHWLQHRSSTSFYRSAASMTVRSQVGVDTPLPHLAAVEVRSWPTYRDRRSWPDVGAWMPATKAVIDGLVDAGVLPGDTSDVVRRLTFDTPRLGTATQLVVVVIPWDRADGWQRIDTPPGGVQLVGDVDDEEVERSA